MNRINLEQKLKAGLSIEEIIKEIFSEMIRIRYDELHKDSTIPDEMKQETLNFAIKRMCDSLVIRNYCVDPRISNIYVYAVCSKREIEILTSFDKDYVTVTKETKKIGKLKKHKPVKFEVYNICYNESNYRTLINFTIIEESQSGANCVLDIIVAENDIRVARERLPYVVNNVKFKKIDV